MLVAIGLYVRVTIAETPVFRRAARTRARVPLFDVLRAYPLVLLLSSGGMVLAYVLFYTITTYSLSYGTTQLELPSTTLLYCTMISVALMGLAVPLFAALSDRVGRRRSPGSGPSRCSGSSTPETPISSPSPSPSA